MKKRISLLIALFVCFNCFLPVSMFAAETTTFHISHSINATSSFYFEFWKYRTTESIPNATVSYTSAGNFGIATLGIAYYGSITISKVEISVTNLVNTDDDTMFCDYVFQVYEPNTTTAIEFTSTSDHGAGYATLFSNRTFTTASASLNTDEIADFKITIDDSDAIAGTYTGYLTFTVTN